LVNYPWPGNVRELKNIAEQISVLSTDKLVTAKTLLKFLPENNTNRLPVLAHVNGNSTHEFANEREILYKLFFDMKKDVTELKRLFFEVMQNPAVLNQNPGMMNELKELQPHTQNEYPSPVIMHQSNAQPAQPVIMHKEKELIIKALKKHKGKRKDAAMDLGISERTLYRKLKEYDIDE
jgi:transcriptional regulator with PAS, ATPase and Fis domain